MIITNFKNLAKNDLRKKALLIAEVGYEAIDIEKIIPERIKIKNNLLKIGHTDFLNGQKSEIKENLDEFKRIFIVGIGKGSALASAALAKILGKKLTGGIALDVQKPKLEIRNCKLEIFTGTHPLPSKKNIMATREIIKLAKSMDKDDLLIVFVCGGGSALACVSEEELKNSVSATKELMKAGANINELNTVRKHLSEFKGGGLAKMACPAAVVSLIVSDVCGNDLSNVASGPTVFDKTVKKDAEEILKKYGLNPDKFNLYETPKDSKCFKKTKNILFVCNQDAVAAMVNKANELGFSSKIRSLALEGEAKNIFQPIIENVKSGEAVIAAGETTVILENKKSKSKNQNYNSKIKISDKGGRNMEAVLGAIAQLTTNNKQQIKNIVFLSFASDGRDNTEAAGAVGDFLTLEKAKKLKLNPEDFFKNHDSFSFFEKTGDLIYAEQKCFNVADLIVIIRN